MHTECTDFLMLRSSVFSLKGYQTTFNIATAFLHLALKGRNNKGFISYCITLDSKPRQTKNTHFKNFSEPDGSARNRQSYFFKSFRNTINRIFKFELIFGDRQRIVFITPHYAQELYHHRLEKPAEEQIVFLHQHFRARAQHMR